MLNDELFDIDAERSILSSCIQSEEVFNTVNNDLKASDFSVSLHSNIFEALSKCYAAGEVAGFSFIKKYKDIKQDDFLDIASTVALVDVSKYVNHIKELSIKRQLLSFAHLIPSKISKLSVAELLEDINKEVFHITSKINTADIKSIDLIVDDLLENYKKIKKEKKGDLVGLDTGFYELNKMLRGFKGGELIVLAARPGMGKTSLCLNFIEKSLRNDCGVVFFSLEMPAVQILQRMIAARASIALQKVLSGDLTSDEWSTVSHICNEYSNKTFYIYDSGYAGVSDISAILRKLKNQHDNIGLCVVDYIGLMMSSTNRFQDRHLQVAEISRGLKLLARELDMPIIALSQLNRSLESRSNKRPMLSDLRESGAIEQDADAILFVYRDEVYREQEEKERINKARAEGKLDTFIPSFEANPIQEKAELIVGKNRNGPVGTVDLVFSKLYSTFHELTKEEVPVKINTTNVEL